MKKMSENNQLNLPRDDFENIETAWEGDLWDRERLGIQLTNYVDRLQCGAVLALDARWGEGKTWFVRHWAKHLTNTDHNVIYLDAFANDYLDDPFLVITSEIANILKQDKSTKNRVNKLIELSASVGTTLLPSLPKVALTLGLHLVGAGLLSGVLQQGYENAKDGIDALSDEAGERIKESIQEKIAGHEAEKETLKEFKKHLANTVDKLGNPLVFIIDELDRCRPDFAIRLIERIKHFFDIPNIVFVLVMNKAQFSKFVSHNYGYDESLGEAYLEKFIDLEVRLPRLKLHEKGMLEQFIFKVASGLGLVAEVHKGALGLAALLALHKKITKRTLEKIISEYSLYSFDNADLNEFLIYVLFNKKMIKDIRNNVKNFFEQVHRELLEIIELYLTEYKYNAYSEIELINNITMDEKELNEWCYCQIDSNFLRQIHIILNSEQKGILDIPELRAHKYHLQKGNSEVDMLESWEVYLYL